MGVGRGREKKNVAGLYNWQKLALRIALLLMDSNKIFTSQVSGLQCAPGRTAGGLKELAGVEKNDVPEKVKLVSVAQTVLVKSLQRWCCRGTFLAQRVRPTNSLSAADC